MSYGMSNNSGLSAPKNKQGDTEATKSTTGSSVETLRQGNKPKPEMAQQAKMSGVQSSARSAWQKSNGDMDAVNPDAGARSRKK